MFLGTYKLDIVDKRVVLPEQWRQYTALRQIYCQKCSDKNRIDCYISENSKYKTYDFTFNVDRNNSFDLTQIDNSDIEMYTLGMGNHFELRWDMEGFSEEAKQIESILNSL